MKNLKTLHSELYDIAESLATTIGIMQTLNRSQNFIWEEYSVGDADSCRLIEDRIETNKKDLDKIVIALWEINKAQDKYSPRKEIEIYKGKVYNSLKKLQSEKGTTFIEVEEASLLLGLPWNLVIEKINAGEISGTLLRKEGATEPRYCVSLNLLEEQYQITYWKSKGALK